MERLIVSTAKVSWFFEYGELNPQGRDLFGDLIEWLKKQYSFEKSPGSLIDLNPETKALDFKLGRYQVREEVFIAVELSLYSDGIIANSWSSTKETEEFLHNVFTMAAAEFHLNFDPRIIRSKMYLSEVQYYSEHQLESINPKLKEISETLASIGGRDCEFAGIQFWFDPTKLPAKAPFRIERKQNTDFGDNRYYSIAPLQTHEHIAALKEIENLLRD
ncbi:MAG: hypothetical protein ACRD1O_01625 [Terriglobia bacterium]